MDLFDLPYHDLKLHLLFVVSAMAAVLAVGWSFRRQLRRAVEPLQGELTREWLLGASARGVVDGHRFMVRLTGAARPVLDALVAVEPGTSRFQIFRRRQLVLAGKRRIVADRWLVVAARELDAERGRAAFETPDGRDLLVGLFDRYEADRVAVTDAVSATFHRRARRALKERRLEPVLRSLAAAAELLERSAAVDEPG